MTSAPYETERLDWQGITVEVRYTPDWSASYREVYGYPLAHLEIESVAPAKAPLPITETGYLSHFCAPADVDAEGGPSPYVRMWLDHEAQSDSWKQSQAERAQLSLF